MIDTLSLKGRLAILAANLLFGQIPFLTFFTWVERNCNLPIHKLGLPWPFFQFSDLPTPILLLWNTFIFATFAIPHTTLAQPVVQQAMKKVIPPQAIRTLFWCSTGLTITWLMGAWQHTKIVLWSLPFSQTTNDIISISLYTMFMCGFMTILFKFDPIEFCGFKQIFQTSKELNRTEGNKDLLTKGIYGWVRHPMYTFMMCAFLITPRMTLDRFWVFFICITYLVSMGVPYEEKKLVKIFGEAYVEYRNQVPAIFPFKLNKKMSKVD